MTEAPARFVRSALPLALPLALLAAGLIVSAVSGRAAGLPAPGAPALAGLAAGQADPRKALPGGCGLRLGQGDYYERGCLMREFDWWPYLPDRCEMRVSAPGRAPVRAYEAGCLAQFGYREIAPGRSVPR